MNKHVTTTPSSSWERPFPSQEFQAKHSKDDIAVWQDLVLRVMEVAKASGWTKAEVTRRCGMKDGTFSQWFGGTYVGRLDGWNKQVSQWLDALSEAAELAGNIRSVPRFMKLRASSEIMDTLRWAQQTSDMVMITLNAGMSKTATCRFYRDTNPHVFHATVSPHTKTVHGMLNELAAELDVREHNPARLTRAIGRRLERIGGGTLLIVDEAQNLVDEAINQLRHFVDIFQCGIALVGNDEVYTRFGNQASGKPSHAQLKSRIGKRMKLVAPYHEDLLTFIDAWGVTDPETVKYLVGIGLKGGALRSVEKTIRLAYMLIDDPSEPLQLKHAQAAWRNRDVEDLS